MGWDGGAARGWLGRRAPDPPSVLLSWKSYPRLPSTYVRWDVRAPRGSAYASFSSFNVGDEGARARGKSEEGRQGVRGSGDGNLAPRPAVGRLSDSLVVLLAYIVCDYIFRGRIMLY